MIRTMPDPDDGRAVALRPSAKGWARYRKVFAEILRSNERVLAPLSAEEIERIKKLFNCGYALIWNNIYM